MDLVTEKLQHALETLIATGFELPIRFALISTNGAIPGVFDPDDQAHAGIERELASITEMGHKNVIAAILWSAGATRSTPIIASIA